MRIYLAADHAGFEMKKNIMEDLQEDHDLIDMGTCDSQSVDYPDMVHPLAKKISDVPEEKGLIFCGSGNGVAMVANKYPNVRAAIAWNPEIASLARKHNDANILAIPSRFVQRESAKEMIRIFLSTSFEGGRHARRVEKINR